MGLMDLPAPLFSWVDAGMAPLPPYLRLVIWGIVAGAATMWLYRAVSPQASIARSKQDQAAMRRRLDEFEGDIGEAWPLIAKLLRLSFGQLGRVLLPTLVAALPVLCLVVWISTAYGYVFPTSDVPVVTASPKGLEARWRLPVGPGSSSPVILVRDPDHERASQVVVGAPVPVIGRWQWWNAVVGNPAGYLPSDGPADRLDIELPERRILDVGPSWMRGWEFTFFASLGVVSLLLRRILGIQ